MVIKEFHARTFHSMHREYCSIKIDIPEPISLAEKQIQDYVISTIQLHKTIRFLPFVLKNKSMMEMAKHYLFHRTGSLESFYKYCNINYKFSQWIGKQPDDLINGCYLENRSVNPQAITYLRNKIDEYILWHRNRGYASKTIYNVVESIIALFRINRIDLNLNFALQQKVTYPCRAITQKELQEIMTLATIREKVIIGILAVSGVRTGTLTKLQYRHVKKDLENRVIPIHLGIEAQITKGNYHGYSTFLNGEVAEYLEQYLTSRRKGSRVIPAEDLKDESPLIRSISYEKDENNSISYKMVNSIFKTLCNKAGIEQAKKGPSRELTTRSLRKFFRTEMSVLGLQKEYVEYMMGHTTDTYLDLRMMGVEYFRRVYRMSGISLIQKPEYDRLRLLKQTIERLDFKPEEVLKTEILNKLN